MIKRLAALTALALCFGQCQGMADDCFSLGGTLAGSECQISTAVSKSGAMKLSETLHILGSGRLSVPAGATLTLNVTGSLILDSGAAISGDAAAPRGVGARLNLNASGDIVLHGSANSGAAITASQLAAESCAEGRAGWITLAAGGNTIVEEGAAIAADGVKCPAGAIAVQGVRVNIGGLVQSASAAASTASNDPFASPRRQPPGGGPITIAAGCDLVAGANAVIRSRGQEPGADLVHLEGGCNISLFGRVESTGIGSVIPNAPSNRCYYQATGFPTPANMLEPADDPVNPRLDKPWNSAACIEVWAGQTLFLTGVEINADTGGTGGSLGTSWIDLFAGKDIAINGPAAGNFAVHANGMGDRKDSGGHIAIRSVGGKLVVSGQGLQADSRGNGSVGGSIIAESSGPLTLDGGNFSVRGDTAFGNGGTVALRSFSGALSWQAGTADLQPVLTGAITLTGCNTVLTGFTFPGSQAGPIVDTACGGLPSLPAYVTLPGCQCYAQPVACKWCTKSAVLDQVVQAAGWGGVIPDVLVDLRLGSAVVDSSKAGTEQPATGSLQAAVNYVIANGDLNGDGVLLIGVTAQDCGSGVAGAGPCAGQPGRAPEGGGKENLVIRNTRAERLNIAGCGVTLTARDPARPAITISNSTGQVFVSGITASGSTGDAVVIQNNTELVVMK